MTMMRQAGLTSPGLWARVAGAHLPIECDGRGFAEHLSDITGLSPRSARRLELEYRRFLYLSVISRELRVPSGLVRVAWSYHAEHEGYGLEFCYFVLGRPLRFTPTLSSPVRAYAATVAAYVREFGEQPPASIWPAPEAPATLPHWHGSDIGPDPLLA